jgi:glycosyltransferase involved in cell wall biosynthesis
MTQSPAGIAPKVDISPLTTPKRRLRIAVLSRVFRSTGGGAERYSMALVEQLAQSHEMHVFAQELAHDWPGVSYHPVSMPLKKPRWINQLWFAVITWWVTRQGFDVVHSHENTWHGQVQSVHVLPIKYNLFQGRTGWRLALRWLNVITSPRLLVYLGLERLRYRLNGPRSIVSTSQSLQAIMAQTYPDAVTAMQIVTPGVAAVPGLASDVDKCAQRKLLGLPEKGRCVLFVANDFKRKGLPTLLQAMRGMPATTYLAVVGHDEQLAQFKQENQSLGLSDRKVFFLGSLGDVGPAYRAADCLAHPTLEDTFAMVVLEAMAHGLPVVVSGARYCGISGLLSDGVNSLLLENPSDSDALEHALSRVMGDPLRYQQLSQEGYDFALIHRWADAAQKMSSIYEALATRSNS